MRLHLHVDAVGRCHVHTLSVPPDCERPPDDAKWHAFDRPIRLRGANTIWRPSPSPLSSPSSSRDSSTLLYLSSARKPPACDVAPPLRSCVNGSVSVQLVQSALQKSVRRGYVDFARRYAKSMLCANTEAFLRRVPIIVAEDATCVDADLLLTCVFLMCAVTRGYRLDARLRDALIELCARAASSPRIERIEKVREDWSGYTCPLNPERPSAVVSALLIRASYGGMTSDVRMLCAFARRWALRIVTPRTNYWRAALDVAATTWPVEQTPDWWERIPACSSRTHVLPESVDFHVFRGAYFDMFRHTSEQMGCSMTVCNMSEKRITLALWLHRSGVYDAKKCYWTDDDDGDGDHGPLVPRDTPFGLCAKRNARRAATLADWLLVQPVVWEIDRRVLDPTFAGRQYARDAAMRVLHRRRSEEDARRNNAIGAATRKRRRSDNDNSSALRASTIRRFVADANET